MLLGYAMIETRPNEGNTKVHNFGKRYQIRSKCDNEILRHIGLDGNAFQKTMKVKKTGKYY